MRDHDTTRATPRDPAFTRETLHGKATWTGRTRLYLIGEGEPGHNAIASVHAMGGRHIWHAYHPEPETPPYAEGWADTPDEAKDAAEAAIRAHARRLLELVGEEP